MAVKQQVMTAQERRAHMENAIREGGVVLYDGRTIGSLVLLPSLAELAETAEEVDQALLDLEARKRQLALDEQRLRSMSASQPLGSGDNITTSQRGGVKKVGDEKSGVQVAGHGPGANAPAK